MLKNLRGLTLATLILGAISALAPSLAMAANYEIYVSVESTKQGKFKSETSANSPHKDRIPAVSFGYGVTNPTTFGGAGSGSGKPNHKALTFTKSFGASSPQFFQALVTGEILKNVTVEFWRPNASGKQELHYTVKLSTAAVTGIQQAVQGKLADEDARRNYELEEISLSFREIEVQDVISKTIAVDDVTQ